MTSQSSAEMEGDNNSAPSQSRGARKIEMDTKPTPEDPVRKRAGKSTSEKETTEKFGYQTPRSYRSGMSTYYKNDFYQRLSSPASDGNESSFLHQALMPPSPHSPPTYSNMNQLYPNNGSSLTHREKHSKTAISNNMLLHRNKLKSSSKQKSLRSRKLSCMKFFRQFSKSDSSISDDKSNNTFLLALAIMFWYCLGVISISSSKLLLSGGFADTQISPLVLTCQQFWIGTKLLSSSKEIQNKHHYLNMSGSCFSVGFLLTNICFFSSHASFVETVKAAEPLSSATIAKLWGIESNISSGEVMSLIGITFGIILSTIGNASGTTNDANLNRTGGLIQSVQVCSMVLLSNFCFSFRGMYQKLYLQKLREKQQIKDVSDVDLQCCMQSLGLRLFIIPTVLWNGYGIFISLTGWFMKHMTKNESSLLAISYISKETLQYSLLAIINGVAFTGYNLASTYVLSRISVVHHAAWNCIRRIFAIVITSIIFQVPVSFVSVCGIVVSIVSFLSYTRFKTLRTSQPRKISALLPMSKVV